MLSSKIIDIKKPASAGFFIFNEQPKSSVAAQIVAEISQIKAENANL